MSTDWEKLCRLCLKDVSCLLSIFRKWCGLDIKIKIQELYGFEIKEEDGLPQNICMACLAKIKSFDKEKELFSENQKLLKVILEQEKSKDLASVEIDGNVNIVEQLTENETNYEKENFEKPFNITEDLFHSETNEDVIEEMLDDSNDNHDENNLLKQEVTGKDNSILEDYEPTGYFLIYDDEANNPDDLIEFKMHNEEETNDIVEVQSNLEILEEEIVEGDQTDLIDYDEESNSMSNTIVEEILENEENPTEITNTVTDNVVVNNEMSHNEDSSTIEYNEHEGSEKKKRTRKRQVLPDHLPRLSDYKCYVCKTPNKFGTDVALTEHLQCHKDLLPFTCDECIVDKTIIKELRKLNNHIRMHNQPFKCDFCDKKYSCKKTVNDHMKLVHLSTPEPVKCPECGKVCGDRAKLNKHMVLHTDKFMCKICAKTFVTITMLKRHELQHKSWEERPSLNCFICGHSYVNKETLELHLASHNQIKHHECKICKERFMRISDLNRHAKLHLSENYKKKKSWKDHYTVEIDSETQDKKYKCNTCENVSANASSIRSHVLGHIRPYKCTYCDESFNDLVAQKDHENKHTGSKPRKCRFCDKKFAHTSTLYFHHKTHPEFIKEKQLHKKQREARSKSKK